MTDWYEGNKRSAKRGVDRAMRVLLEGKLEAEPADYATSMARSGSSLGRVESFPLGEVESTADMVGEGERGGGGGGGSGGGVPVPLVLCVTGALMHLIAAGDERNGDNGNGSDDGDDGDNAYNEEKRRSRR